MAGSSFCSSDVPLGAGSRLKKNPILLRSRQEAAAAHQTRCPGWGWESTGEPWLIPAWMLGLILVTQKGEGTRRGGKAGGCPAGIFRGACPPAFNLLQWCQLMKCNVLLTRFYFLCLKNNLCDCCGLFSIILGLRDLSFIKKNYNS